MAHVSSKSWRVPLQELDEVALISIVNAKELGDRVLELRCDILEREVEVDLHQ